MTLTLRGYAVVDKVAQRSGSSALVYVPHDWIGKRVQVVCLDP
jgi:putative transposon-encoded protein